MLTQSTERLQIYDDVKLKANFHVLFVKSI